MNKATYVVLVTVGLMLAFGLVTTAPANIAMEATEAEVPFDDPEWHDAIKCEGSQDIKKLHLWTAGTARVTGHAVLHYNKIRKSDGKELWRTVTERACTVRYDVQKVGTLDERFYAESR